MRIIVFGVYKGVSLFRETAIQGSAELCLKVIEPNNFISFL